MARDSIEWHPNFYAYMEMIMHHPNYKGLPIEKRQDGSHGWIATAKSEIGKGRIAWCEAKAKILGIPVQPGVYAEVMREIHPTKWKVCQTCGEKMSIYYHYPNAHFLKALNKKFSCDFSECDHISDIWDALIKKGYSGYEIANFLISKGSLYLNPRTAQKDEVISALELACRAGNKGCLGPGAMSNFPDRFDGFHSYNRCCRSTLDKGRSKANLKSYTKDRRAYEYWNDGNIHAANQFMGSAFFNGTSADHVGPISLGFIHDPRYLQPMSASDNSAKRDRLQLVDIEKIVSIEKRTGVYPMSWYSQLIWEYIKKNYATHHEKISGPYREALKQSMSDFMFILMTIIDKCGKTGEEFLIHSFLKKNYRYFDYSYEFNSRGDIVKEEPRHYTARGSNETDRYARIAIESVRDFNDKDNRNISPDLTSSEKLRLNAICSEINTGCSFEKAKKDILQLVRLIENRIISYI